MKRRTIIALLLAALLALAVVIPAAATEEIIATGTVYSATGTLNVRAGPGTQYEKVGMLYTGDRVEIYEIKPPAGAGYGWGRIDIGWVSMQYIDLDPDPTEAPDDGYDLVIATGLTDADKEVDVYEGPGLSYDVIFTLFPGSDLGFYKFQTADGIEWGQCGYGWVNMEDVTLYGESIDPATITAKGMRDGVAWVLYDDGTLSITGDCTSNRLDSSLPAPWKDYADQVRTLRFEPGSIGYAGNASFRDMVNLETVYVSSCPFSVQNLFLGCENFTTYKVIDAPGVRYVEQDGLLLDVEMPNKLLSCPTGRGGRLELPESITIIGEYAFQGCNELDEVILPEGLDAVDDYAFAGCTDLESITFPASTRYLCLELFDGCTGLKTICFEGSAPETSGFGDVIGRTFGDYVEVRNPKDTRITATAYYPADDHTWTQEAMEALGGNITWVAGSKPAFPEEVAATGTVSSSTGSLNVRSGPGADYGKVETLYNSDRVVIFETRSVSGSEWGRISTGWIAMDYVDLDEDAAVIHSASWDRTDADDVTWTFDTAGTLTISGTGEMEDCRLWSIDWDNTENWYRGWDKYINDIKTVIIEDGITYVGDSSFQGAENLKTVIIADSVREIGDMAFSTCTSLTRIALGRSLEETGIQVFENCDSLVSFTFPNYEVDYGNDMFLCCDKLQNITFPENMTAIAGGMFEECTGLTGIVIPDTITAIGGSAFASCYNLAQVTIPDSVTSIGTKAFYDCNSLTSVTVPGSVAEISTSMFDSCDSLVSVTLSEGTTTMGSSVFSLCNKLTEVTVPGSVTIMHHTFCDAFGLKTVRFLGHAPAFASDLFGHTTLTAYYPSNFESWTADIRQQYGGTVNWVGYTSSYDPGDIRVRGTCGENVTWKLKFDGTLVIEGTGEMENYGSETPWTPYASLITKIQVNRGITAIGTAAFYELRNAEKATIADTVTEIRTNSFFRCSALKEITLPDSVTRIGERAFNECASLTSVTMGDHVASIDMCAFLNCTSLSEVEFSAGLTSIAQQAFAYTALGDVVLPDGLTTIKPGAFTSCSMTSVVIPDSVTELGRGAFSDTGLASVTIGKGVTEIPSNTFASTQLTTVRIPSNVRSIGYWAFQNCASLETVYFEGDAPAIEDAAFDGVTAAVYYPAGNTTWTEDVMHGYGGELTWAPEGAEVESPFPEGVIAVGKVSSSTGSLNIRRGPGTNYEKTGVLSSGDPVEIYDYRTVSGVKWGRVDIGWINMSYVKLDADQPEAVAIVDSGDMNGYLLWWKLCEDGTFFYSGKSGVSGPGPDYYPWHQYRDQITAVFIIGNTPYVSGSAFNNCTNLTRVFLCEGLESIDSGAFSGCTALESVTIPASVTQIHGFSGCTALKEVILAPGSQLETIGDGAFGYSGLQSISLPDTVRTIGEGAFRNCADLAEVTLRDGITFISWYAFAECPSLTGELYLSETIEEIKMYAFDTAPGFSRVTINTNAAYALDFSGSTVLTSVTYGGNALVIGVHMFQNCTALEEVIINGPITHIRDEAFAGCTALKEITLPETLTTIDFSVFEGSGLTSIVIPDSVTKLGSWSFQNCADLVEAHIGTGDVSLDNRMFENCTSLETVRLPGVQSITYAAFSGCTSLKTVEVSDDLTLIGEKAFSGCTSLTRFEFPAAVTDIYGEAFANCTALTELVFTGDAPSMDPNYGNPFLNVTATARYPAGNPTWTADVMQNYGGQLTWEPLDETPAVDYGDVNGDGRINSMDIILLRQYLAGWDVTVDPSASDVNADGRVNTMDMILLRQYVAGWDVTLGG